MSASAKALLTTRESKTGNSSSRANKTNFFPPTNSPIDQISFLQRTVGNREVERLLKSGAIQAKLTIGQSGDPYEREADRLSEQVMSMPEIQPNHTPERLQAKRVGLGGLGQTAVPPIVHKALRSPGRPLDAATRSLMEQRFGHDFSRVRIHTEAQAAESARAVNALAYTVGPDMVFGAGQYVPDTSEGRQLVAHELTHVVQQTTASSQLRSADFASSSVGSDVLQRKPDKPTQAEARQEQQLEELAQDPGLAHQAWKKLSQMEQTAVVERMRRRYGGPFAQKFLDEVKKGKPQIEYSYYQPGSGPKPDQLIASGYRSAGMLLTGNAAFEVEVWVHPSGRRISRDVSTYKFGAGKKEESPPKLPEDPVTELLKKLENIQQRLWPAMADFEANVESLESNPQHADREQIEADIVKGRNAVRRLTGELSDLKRAADDIDESVADRISDVWMDAMEEWGAISTRYYAIQ